MDDKKFSSLRLSPAMLDELFTPTAPRQYTVDEIREMFKPAATLGAAQDVQLAMDQQLMDTGVYSLIQHAYNLGQDVAPQFMGYGALQGLAQNGLIRACIETVADDMVREWIELKSSNDSVEPEQIARLERAMRNFNVRDVFHEAAEYVGYEGGAMIFIDTGAAPEELEKPLNLSEYSMELRQNKLKGFTVLDPVNLFPGDYNSLYPMKKDYYKPKYWYVLGTKVHSSRLIRLVANECPTLLKPAYNFFGIPQAQLLYDYVLHFQDCRIAVTRLLKKFSLLTFKTNIGEILYAQGGTQEIDARINFMLRTMNNQGVWVMDTTEEAQKLETPLSGLTDIVKQNLEFLTAINRTPAVKLLGISPSGFNATGESDIRNYYDHVLSQCNKVFRHGLETVLKILQLHCFGKINTSIDFDFKPLGQEDEASLAMTQKTKIETLATAVGANFITEYEGRAAIANDPDSGIDIGAEPPQELKDKIEAQQGGEDPMAGMGAPTDLADLMGPTGEQDDEPQLAAPQAAM